MKWFGNWRLSWKFAVLAAALLIGFAFIGVAYRAVLTTGETASAQVQRADALGGLVQDIDFAVQKARGEQGELRATNKLEYLEGFDESMTAAAGFARDLDPFMSGEEEAAMLSRLLAAMETYRSGIYTVAESQIAIGLDRDSGIRGEIRGIIHDIEAVLQEYDLRDLMVSMLSMRRYEKNFLAQHDDEYVQRMTAEQESFQRLLADIGPKKETSGKKEASGKAEKAAPAGLPEEVRADLAEKASLYYQGFLDLAETAKAQQADLRAADDALVEIRPLLDSLRQLKTQRLTAANGFAASENQHITGVFVAILIAIAGFSFLMLWLISFSVTKPVARLQNVVGEIAGGNYGARAQLGTKDELGRLGEAFDGLLEERVAYLAQAEAANERLNDSVVDLLQAVAQLSKKDLTIHVPVKEDVTGPVADALNLLSGETAKVLRDVTRIANDVANASKLVKSQSDAVVSVTSEEREQVEHTVANLVAAAESMQSIAAQAQTSNQSADEAIGITQRALQLVDDTVSGISTIRDTIRETEKRIKRLGERSQEITGTVNLINNIAERTHILALNASMHAASAGEAGRGFAVVADEVQRLAENAREATSEIATLVNNIQVETSDTVAAMNRAITQVVEGTDLAEQAGSQMKATQKATADLVALVQRIASSSQEQAQISRAIADRSIAIRTSTERTRAELDEQSKSTSRLVDFAAQLLTSVRVFRLPEAAG